MPESTTADFALVNQFLADTTDRKTKAALNSEYWKFIEELVREKVDGKSEFLNFTPDEKLKIDLGLINENLVNKEKINLDNIKSAYQDISPHDNSYHLSDWLNIQFEKILKKPKKRKVEICG